MQPLHFNSSRFGLGWTQRACQYRLADSSLPGAMAAAGFHKRREHNDGRTRDAARRTNDRRQGGCSPRAVGPVAWRSHRPRMKRHRSNRGNPAHDHGALDLGGSGSSRRTPAPWGDTRACHIRYTASDFCGKTNGRSGRQHPRRCPVAECFAEGVVIVVLGFAIGVLQGLNGTRGRQGPPRLFHLLSALECWGVSL